MRTSGVYRPFAAWLLAWAAIGVAPSTRAGVCPEFIDAFPVAAIHLELLTDASVWNHLPGPAPGQLGDGLIGTADDGVSTEPSVHGAPNDLGRERTGLPGSPGTKRLHGSSLIDSEESGPHEPEAHTLSLARPGEGSLSYLRFRVGTLETWSYLGGGVSIVPPDGRFVLRGGTLPFHVAQATAAGTALVPDVLFRGPFNLDLVTISPGEDRKFATRDDVGEAIGRGCNGFSLGVDGLDPRGEPLDWQPLGPGPFPKLPRTRFTNQGELDPSSAKAFEPDGRRIEARVDLVAKVPTSGVFFVTPEIRLAGYGFPRKEAEGLLTPSFHPDGNLPDIPGFPGSGQGLARYIVEVVVPLAQARGHVFVGFLRGTGVIEIIGVPVPLEFTLVGSGGIGEFDLCRLDTPACE